MTPQKVSDLAYSPGPGKFVPADAFTLTRVADAPDTLPIYPRYGAALTHGTLVTSTVGCFAGALANIGNVGPSIIFGFLAAVSLYMFVMFSLSTDKSPNYRWRMNRALLIARCDEQNQKFLDDILDEEEEFVDWGSSSTSTKSKPEKAKPKGTARAKGVVHPTAFAQLLADYRFGNVVTPTDEQIMNALVADGKVIPNADRHSDRMASVKAFKEARAAIARITTDMADPIDDELTRLEAEIADLAEKKRAEASIQKTLTTATTVETLNREYGDILLALTRPSITEERKSALILLARSVQAQLDVIQPPKSKTPGRWGAPSPIQYD